MEHLNRILFLWINAPEHASDVVVTTATLFAEWLIWAIPALIGIGWLRGKDGARKAMLVATTSGLLGLFINQIIGLFWFHPRPFMIDLGHTLIPHVADSSFPSDHLTLWWAVAFSLSSQSGLQRLQKAGVGLALLGIPIAWARIYLGVHFPLDMLGAIAVAAVSTKLAWLGAALYLRPTYELAMRIHHGMFVRLIALGWVRP